jgi:hypothetical protein
MTLTLQLKPEVEERLLAHAQAQGVSLETDVAGMIEERVLPDPKRRPSLEEFEADLEAIAEGTDAIPVLPPEALTREAIYAEPASRSPSRTPMRGLLTDLGPAPSAEEIAEARHEPWSSFGAE